MTTEAGKRLSADIGYGLIDDDIAAIEAEAVAAERTRIAEAVRGLPTATRYYSDEDPPLRVVPLQSVLDLVEP